MKIFPASLQNNSSFNDGKRRLIFLSVFLVVTVIFVILLTVFQHIRNHRDTVRLVSEQLDRQQLILARSVASQIETFLTYIANDLSRLSVLPGVINMDDGVLEQIESFYRGIPPKTSLRRIDKDGILRFVYPEEFWRGTLIGKDYSAEDYFLSATSGKDIVLSGLILNEVGEMRIRIAKPVYVRSDSEAGLSILSRAALRLQSDSEKVFNGIIVGSFDLQALSAFVAPIVSGKSGYAWLMNEEGMILAHYEKDFVGQNAFKIREKKNPALNYDAIYRIQKEMTAGKEGMGHYVSGWHRHQKGNIEKIIAYTPVRVFDKIWSVAVCVPVEELEGLVRNTYRENEYVIAMIILILGIGSVVSFLIPYRWSRILQKEIDRRKQTEDALGESKRFSSSLIAAMKDGLCVIDSDGVHIDVNPAFCEMTGFSREELIGTGLSYPYWSEARMEDIRRTYQKIMSGEFEDFELMFRRKNGEQFPVILSPSCIRDKGNVLRYFANIKNIEKRKKAIAAMQESEEHLRVVIEKIADGIIIADSEGIVFFANPAAEFLFEKNSCEFVGKAFPFPLSAEKTAIIEIPQKDGETSIAEMRTVALKRNGKVFYLASLRDITDNVRATELEKEKIRLEAVILERKRAEESVKIAYTELRQIFHSSGDGMYVTDNDFNILRLNKRMEDIFGVSEAEAVSKKCYDIFKLNICHTRKCPMFGVSENEEIIQRDIEKEQSGGIRMLSITATPFRNAAEQRLGMIFNLKDLTRRFCVEKALQESENRYRTIFENTSVAIFIAEENTIISMANHEFEKLTCFSKSEIEDKMTWKDFFVKDQLEKMEHYHHVRRIDPKLAPRKYEAQLIDRHGRIKEVCLTAAMIPETRKSIISILNITELKQIRKDLQHHLEKRQAVMRDTIEAMAMTIEKRDPYTAGHQRRVADLACAIAKEMMLSEVQIEGIRMAGVIHDLGKIRVPAEILSKPDKLTEHEFAIIKDHPQIAYDILKKIDFPWPVALMILQHHERINGSGYPKGLSGEEILLESRILSVADVIEAMAFHRPYRPALGIESALEEIYKNRGVFYDIEVVNICLKLFLEKRFEFG
jgi:PAS domain S-box-containing protein